MTTSSAQTRTTAREAVRVGPGAEIPVGEGRAYAVDGDQVAVFRLRSGALRAISAICPHAGGPLADGQIDDQVVICPLHLNVFELDTGCSRSGQEKLLSYPVEEDADGYVVIHQPE
ncbi:MAG TPA: Rieske (2Fe-2S) protein [Kineosporiaceae bacterium]|nr:Rieske (2Fe-2S) protein [Kineosporiaceae bacterium]